MQTMMRSRFALALGLLSLPLLAGAATIPITQCQTIQQPGKYHVVQDLVQALPLPCLEVLASDVEIHLDGYTIRSVGTGIRVINQSNVSITGSGTIEAGSIGILLYGANGAKIVDVTVHMFSGGGHGVRLERSSNAIVIGNTIFTSPDDDPSSVGISLLLGGDNIIRSNTVSRFVSGILAVSSTGNLFQANTVSAIQWDLREHDDCGVNTWKSNKFTTFFGQCIQ